MAVAFFMARDRGLSKRRYFEAALTERAKRIVTAFSVLSKPFTPFRIIRNPCFLEPCWLWARIGMNITAYQNGYERGGAMTRDGGRRFTPPRQRKNGCMNPQVRQGELSSSSEPPAVAA